MHRLAELEASVSVQDVQTSMAAPDFREPSLIVPELEFGVAGRVGFAEGFYIGGHVNLAFIANSAPNYSTTPHPGTVGPAVFSGGPDIGMAGSFGDTPVGWGVFGSLTAMLAWEFSQDIGGPVGQVPQLMGFYRAGLALHFFSREVLSGELGVAVQNYVINDIRGGFSLDQHGVVPYLGLRVVADNGIYGYAQMHFPLGFEYTNAQPVAGVFGFGATFGPPTPENRLRSSGTD